MITVEETTTVVHSTLTPLASRVMGMSTAALASMTDSLVNLYTDKSLAVIREYATNARDAHAAAGVAEPVLVQLPDEYNSSLVVTDFGVGMSHDQVLDFYSQYGDSDKRESNEGAGKFGYGCKVGFAISDQFTVTSVKDGLKTIALFSRNAQRVGTVDILAHAPTDEPSGTRITVPVVDVADMARAVRQFFWGWAPGEVEVTTGNGEPVPMPSLHTKGSMIAGVRRMHTAEVEATMPSHLMVLMGGVLYPMGPAAVGTGWNEYGSQNGHFIVHAEIGAVDLPPSREGLRDSSRVKQFLAERLDAFNGGMQAEIETEVEGAKTLAEAAELVYRRADLLKVRRQNVRFQWQGQPVNVSLDIPWLTWFRNTRKKRMDPGKGTFRVGISGHMVDERYTESPSVLVVTGVPEDKAVRENLTHRMHWMCEREGFARVVLAPEEDFRFEWFDQDTYRVRTVTYEEYRELRKAPKQPSRAGRGVRYQTRVPGKRDVPERTLADLRAVGRIFYTQAGHVEAGRMLAFVGTLPEDSALVVLTRAQKLETLLKRFPAARSLQVLVDKEVRAQIRSFTHRHREVLSTQRNQSDAVLAKSLQPLLGEITNQHAAHVIGMLASAKSLTPAQLEVVARYQRLKAAPAVLTGIRLWNEMEADIGSGLSSMDLLAQYPLLQGLRFASDDGAALVHAVQYLNVARPCRAESDTAAA